MGMIQGGGGGSDESYSDVLKGGVRGSVGGGRSPTCVKP